MKIALCQIDTTIGDLEGNTQKILDYYNKALKMGADIAVFPELTVTGYGSADILNYKAFVDRQQHLIERKITPEIKECAIIIGGVTHNYWSGKPYFNSSIFITHGRMEYVLSKRLLPSYNLFNEERFFEPGHRQIPFEYKGQRIGLSVCEDMWRGEGMLFNKLYKSNPIEEMGNEGVDIFINISSSPFYTDKDIKRHDLMKKYSKRWSVPFVMVNSVGANSSVVFDGRSKIYGKNGNLICEAKAFKEDIILYDTNTAQVYDEKKELISLKEKSTKYQQIKDAIILGLRDYVKKQGFNQFVIGMSGGIDSAVVASLAVEAVGAENVYCITMPTRFSSKGSVNDSLKLCKNIGVDLIKVPIEKLFQEYMQVLDKTCEKVKSLTMENIQARIRGDILMAYTNNLDKVLLLATGNKSEIAVGYNTLYGDTNGALSPIGDLYKTEVYELAHFINSKKEIIPKVIIDKAPSAELNIGQLDQDTLPEYETLDQILFNYIEKEKLPNEIAEETNIDINTIRDIIKKVSNARHKRKQLPPVIKLSTKAFEVDRKWPVVFNSNWILQE